MEILRGTAMDGRAENVRYRQDQLHRLHASLRSNSDGLLNVLSKDLPSTEAAEIEFFLAMDSVVKIYDSLDFDKSLKEEYLLKDGKDNLSRRVGFGVVAIRPGTHSRLYSVVTPIAAALAAGNCIYLELNKSSSSVDVLLEKILLEALDRDILATTSSFTTLEISQADLFIDGTSSTGQEGKSPPSEDIQRSVARSIAIVDRTADLQQAAKAIVSSRRAPNNRSPYSPDLVIVNDFLLEEFKKACLDYGESSWSHDVPNEGDAELQGVITKAEKAGQVKVTRSTTFTLSLLELKDSSCSLTTTKISGPCILILPSTGIVDTITSQKYLPENISTYIYADAGTAKVLAEQIPSAASYINQIPAQLLVGPISKPHSLHPRYSTDMFSVSRPQIISAAPKIPTFAEELRRSAAKPLQPTGQRPGRAVGFFEQGIFIGLGTTVFVVLPLVSWLVWTVGRRGVNGLGHLVAGS